MSEVILGNLAPKTGQRDAIHVAVAPVIAATQLKPGTHVLLDEAGHACEAPPPVEGIGVVDPFLRADVKAGELFWLCLYPKTVSGLRHDWSHPSFQERSGDSDAAQTWITTFAAQWKYSFDEFMTGAREYLQKDYELDDNWAQLDVPDEDWNTFWQHFHTLTGLSINDKDKAFVTCCP